MLHSTRAVRRPQTASPRPMNAPLPPILDYPFPARPPPGRTRELRPAFTGCACRCRSRSTTSICGCSPTASQGRRSIAVTATPRRASSGSAISPGRWTAGRSRRSSRRTTTPITSATRRGSAARFGVQVTMPHAEYLTAARDVARPAAAIARRGYRVAARARLDAAACGGAGGARQRLPARRAGAARHASALRCDDEVRSGRHACRVIPGFGHSPEHAALHCGRWGLRLRRHAAAADQHQRQRVAGRARRRPAAPLPRFADGVRGAAADTLVLPSHGLPFVGTALGSRNCARITPHGSPSSRPRKRRR